MCCPLHAKNILYFVFVEQILGCPETFCMSTRHPVVLIGVNRANSHTHNHSVSLSHTHARTRTHARPQAHTHTNTHTHTVHCRNPFRPLISHCYEGRKLKHVADFQNKLRCGVGKSIKVLHAVTISCTHTHNTGTSSLLIIRDICSVFLLFIFWTPSLQVLHLKWRRSRIYGRRTVHQTENLWNRMAAMSDMRKRDAGTSCIAITAAAAVFAEYVI